MKRPAVGNEHHVHHSAKHHVCVHDKIDPKLKRTIRAKQSHHSIEGSNVARRASQFAPPAWSDATYLRIHLEKDWAETSADAAKISYLEDLVDDAKEWLQDTLSVKRLTAPLKLQQECASEASDGTCEEAQRLCGEYEPPAAFYADADFGDFPGGLGVPAADTVIFVTATPTTLCLDGAAGDTVAYAVTCQRDADTDRPLAGWLNICEQNVFASNSPRERQLAVNALIHEMIHILGFSNENFAFWRDATSSNFDPRTPRCGGFGAPVGNGPGQCREAELEMMDGLPPYTDDSKTEFFVASTTVKALTERGSEPNAIRKIVTPEVSRVAKEHFDCASVEGAELENFVSTLFENGEYYSLAGSHFEKRVFYNELMVAEQSSSAFDVPRSAFTLAVLKDSGWYDVQYSNADQFLRGKNSKCEYAEEKCDINARDWCRDTARQGLCVYDLSAVGDCAASNYTRDAMGQSTIPAQYQYFPTPIEGGNDQLMDFCPAVLPYDNGRCDQEEAPSWDLRECGTGLDTERSCKGMLFGADSVCLESTLWEEQHLAKRRDTWDQQAGCYRIRCVKDTPTDPSVSVQIWMPDKSWHECDRAATAALWGEGYVGEIKCPSNPQDLCANRPVEILDDGSSDGGGGFVSQPSSTPSAAARAAGSVGWQRVAVSLLAPGAALLWGLQREG